MRKLNKVILASLMGWTILINPSVEAGIVTDRFPIQTYADHQVNTYNNPGDSKRAGYASANVDLIRVLEYRQDGWARVQHPGAGGRIVNRWCRMTDLCADPNYSNRSVKINGRYVVYRTRSSGSQFGSVNNEEVIVLADNGNRAQILYKLDNGQGYKIGWIASSAVASRGTTQNNTIKNNPMINTNVQHNQVIENGWYQISPQHDQGRVLDVAGVGTANGTNLQTWSRGDVNQQKFYVQNRGNGYFSLKAGHCDLYVTADGTNGGANVSMRTWNGRDSQLFRAENAGNGYYYIISKASNLIMECAGGGRRDGNNVSMWHKDATVGWYKWRFIGTSISSPIKNNLRYPMNDIYVCGNDWMTKYSKRPTRPYHAGIDVNSSSGDKTIYSIGAGTVASTGWNSANGYFVIIKHTISDKIVYSFYCHMSKVLTSKNSNVISGTPIGIIGNTGSASAGTHLHFAIVDKLMSSGGYWGYVTTSGNVVNYQGYTFYSPAYVIDNQRLP